jgi:hypothetical protein
MNTTNAAASAQGTPVRRSMLRVTHALTNRLKGKNGESGSGSVQ